MFFFINDIWRWDWCVVVWCMYRTTIWGIVARLLVCTVFSLRRTNGIHFKYCDRFSCQWSPNCSSSPTQYSYTTNECYTILKFHYLEIVLHQLFFYIIFVKFLFSLGGVGVWISFFTELNRWNTRKVTKFGKKYVKIQYLTAIGVLHTFQSSTLFPRIISVNKYIFVIFTMSFLGETL